MLKNVHAAPHATFKFQIMYTMMILFTFCGIIEPKTHGTGEIQQQGERLSFSVFLYGWYDNFVLDDGATSI